MGDIDKEISFLDEKIKELSNASMRIKGKERQKTSTPVTARDSGIGASEQRETGCKGEYGGAKPKVKFNLGIENHLKLFQHLMQNCMKLKQISVRILKHHAMLLIMLSLIHI